jgi:hypothetical protein
LQACHFGAELHSFTDDMLTRQLLQGLDAVADWFIPAPIGIVCKKGREANRYSPQKAGGSPILAGRLCRISALLQGLRNEAG